MRTTSKWKSIFTAEFKNALKSLGARYPQAYDEFVRQLQPTERQVSHVRVQQAAASATMATTDESIVPQFSGNTSALPSGMVRVQVTKNRNDLIARLVDALPKGRVSMVGGKKDKARIDGDKWEMSSLDEEPVAGVSILERNVSVSVYTNARTSYRGWLHWRIK